MENLERKFNIGFLSVSLFVLLSLLGLYIILEITESKPTVNLASNYNIIENII